MNGQRRPGKTRCKASVVQSQANDSVFIVFSREGNLFI